MAIFMLDFRLTIHKTFIPDKKIHTGS